MEVLRGPQGTLYGANALAGVINMQSKQATNDLDMNFQSTVGNYNTRSVGVAVGGPLIKDTLLGRIAVHTHRSDGYMDNDFLGRDNTQNQDELTARGHLKWLVNNDLTIDLNLLHLNIDNGYDAFTLDNSRNSLSDQPGEDKQHTNAFALKTDWRANSKVQLQSTLTYSKSDLEYSYDDDWSFIGQFDPSLGPYSGFDQYKRERENYSFEFRTLSNEDGRIFANTTVWSVGIYLADQRQDLKRKYFDNDTPDVYPLDNVYKTFNSAIYGQLDTALTEKLTLITGLRIEHWDADYEDSQGLDLDDSDVLFGGKIGLNYRVRPQHLLYTSLSRGYKAGGVNTEADLAPGLRKFNNEYLWNLEAGMKSLWLDGSLVTDITAFYALRQDAQTKTSVGVPRDGGGTRFIDYQDNAAKGRNMGIEASVDWLVNERLRTFAAIGLLHATFDEYDNPELDEAGVKVQGRRQAHAPAYTFSIGSEVYLTPQWTLRANVEGKDEFYYSNSHNAKSSSYAITNASLQYQQQNWTFTLWGRNLFDKDYYTRGFFFGIDPSAGYEDRVYTQYADPRTFGMTVSYDY